MLQFNDERLKEAFVRIEQKKENSKENRRKKFEPFKKLGIYTVFSSDIYIETANLGEKEAFKKAAGYIYSWIKSRFQEVFDELPEEISTFDGSLAGYTVNVDYDCDNLIFSQRSTHLDSKISNRVWISKAVIEKDDRGLHFTVSNEYAEPSDRYRDNENMLFSRPNFYGEIADNIGIIDVEKLKESAQYVEHNQCEKLADLIDDKLRKFPVVVFIAKDQNWINKFDVDYFAYLVGYYAHIRILDIESGRNFASKYNIDLERFQDSVSIFYPERSPKTSYKEDIEGAKYEVIKLQGSRYWNELGCRAFRRKLVSEIRDYSGGHLYR